MMRNYLVLVCVFVSLLYAYEVSEGEVVLTAMKDIPSFVPLASDGTSNDWCATNWLEEDAAIMDDRNKENSIEFWVVKYNSEKLPKGRDVSELHSHENHDVFAKHAGSSLLLMRGRLQDILQTLRLLESSEHVERLCLMRPNHKLLNVKVGRHRRHDVSRESKCLIATTFHPISASFEAQLTSVLPSEISLIRGDSAHTVQICMGHLKNETSLLEAADIVAQHNNVYVVERVQGIKFSNAYSRGRLETGSVGQEPFGVQLGITGNGHVVGVSDTGIDHDHCFFHDPEHEVPYNTFSKDHRKIARYATISTAEGAKLDSEPGHGTHVCGSLAGSVGESGHQDTQEFHGVVPNARLSFTDLEFGGNSGGDTISMPPSLQKMFMQAYTDGARVHTNSWGSGAGEYSTFSKEVDEFSTKKEGENMLLLFSAGNEADIECRKQPNDAMCDRYTVMVPSTSKNAISVGASMAPYLSWVKASQGNFFLRYSTGGTEARKGYIAVRADFGPSGSKALLHESTAVAAIPFNGCIEPSNNVKGRVALFIRGDCHFVDIARHAQNVGAAGVVIINNVNGDPIMMGCDKGKVACQIDIPTFMMKKEDGYHLKKLLLDGVAVVVSITPTDQEDPHKSDENLSTFSSHGPTEDFRFKPDLVGVGEFVHSALSDGDLSTKNCELWPSMGTSMATPLVAGLAVQVQEYFARGFFRSGVENTSIGFFPTATLVKAVLIQSCVPLMGLFDRNGRGDWRKLPPPPSFEQGHGIPRLNTTLPTEENGNVKLFFKQDELATGDVVELCVDFSGFSGSFSATLVWNDPASTPLATHHLINDLDLVVITPEGDQYMGNKNERNIPGSDVLNNVEKATVRQAAAGAYTLRVVGKAVPGGKQAFSLVSSGVAREECPKSGEVSACQNGRIDDKAKICVCDAEWMGLHCNIPLTTISSREHVHRMLLPSQWDYFLWQSAVNGMVHIRVEVANGDTDIDVYVAHSVPSLIMKTSSDPKVVVVKDTKCSNCGSANGPPATTLQFVGQPSVKYFIGVVGMCCNPVLYTMTVSGASQLHSVTTITVNGHRGPQVTIAETAVNEVRITGLFRETSSSSLAVSFGARTRTEHNCRIFNVTSSEIVCRLFPFDCDRESGVDLLLRVGDVKSNRVAYPHNSVAALRCAKSPSDTMGHFDDSGLRSESSEKDDQSTDFVVEGLSLVSNTTRCVENVTFCSRSSRLLFPPAASARGDNLVLFGVTPGWAKKVSHIAIGNQLLEQPATECVISSHMYEAISCQFEGVGLATETELDILVQTVGTPAWRGTGLRIVIRANPTVLGCGRSALQNKSIPTISMDYLALTRGIDLYCFGDEKMDVPQSSIEYNISHSYELSEAAQLSVSFGSIPCIEVVRHGSRVFSCHLQSEHVHDTLLPLYVTALPFPVVETKNVGVKVGPITKIVGLRSSTTSSSAPSTHILVGGDMSVTIVGSGFPSDVSVDITIPQGESSKAAMADIVSHSTENIVIVLPGEVNVGTTYSLIVRFDSIVFTTNSSQLTFVFVGKTELLGAQWKTSVGADMAKKWWSLQVQGEVPPGRLLLIAGKGFPSYDLLEVVLRGEDMYEFPCDGQGSPSTEVNSSDVLIACRVSPYAFGVRTLDVRMKGSIVSVPHPSISVGLGGKKAVIGGFDVRPMLLPLTCALESFVFLNGTGEALHPSSKLILAESCSFPNPIAEGTLVTNDTFQVAWKDISQCPTPNRMFQWCLALGSTLADGFFQVDPGNPTGIAEIRSAAIFQSGDLVVSFPSEKKRATEQVVSTREWFFEMDLAFPEEVNFQRVLGFVGLSLSETCSNFTFVQSFPLASKPIIRAAVRHEKQPHALLNVCVSLGTDQDELVNLGDASRWLAIGTMGTVSCVSSEDDCHSQGACLQHERVCNCQNMFKGEHCTTPCQADPFLGVCSRKGACNPSNGECRCVKRHVGRQCQYAVNHVLKEHSGFDNAWSNVVSLGVVLGDNNHYSSAVVIQVTLPVTSETKLVFQHLKAVVDVALFTSDSTSAIFDVSLFQLGEDVGQYRRSQAMSFARDALKDDVFFVHSIPLDRVSMVLTDSEDGEVYSGYLLIDVSSATTSSPTLVGRKESVLFRSAVAFRNERHAHFPPSTKELLSQLPHSSSSEENCGADCIVFLCVVGVAAAMAAFLCAHCLFRCCDEVARKRRL